jgi:hypothetical protein
MAPFAQSAGTVSARSVIRTASTQSTVAAATSLTEERLMRRIVAFYRLMRYRRAVVLPGAADADGDSLDGNGESTNEEINAVLNEMNDFDIEPWLDQRFEAAMQAIRVSARARARVGGRERGRAH